VSQQWIAPGTAGQSSWHSTSAVHDIGHIAPPVPEVVLDPVPVPVLFPVVLLMPVVPVLVPPVAVPVDPNVDVTVPVPVPLPAGLHEPAASYAESTVPHSVAAPCCAVASHASCVAPDIRAQQLARLAQGFCDVTVVPLLVVNVAAPQVPPDCRATSSSLQLAGSLAPAIWMQPACPVASLPQQLKRFWQAATTASPLGVEEHATAMAAMAASDAV
jgi:hypothetical protein